jgi:hypothetical protein
METKDSPSAQRQAEKQGQAQLRELPHQHVTEGAVRTRQREAWTSNPPDGPPLTHVRKQRIPADLESGAGPLGRSPRRRGNNLLEQRPREKQAPEPPPRAVPGLHCDGVARAASPQSNGSKGQPSRTTTEREARASTLEGAAPPKRSKRDCPPTAERGMGKQPHDGPPLTHIRKEMPPTD